MKTLRSLNVRLLRQLFLQILFVCLVSLTFDVSAQAPVGESSNGFSVGKRDRVGMGDVSLYDGTLSFDVPLIDVAGRGAVPFSSNLRIRGEWEVETTFDNSYEPQYVQSVVYKGTFSGGLDYRNPRVGYGPGVLLIKRDYTPSQYSTGYTLTRLYFYNSAGSRVELRDLAYSGQEKPRGTNRGKHFISSDGSAMTFISDANVIDRTCAYFGQQGCSEPSPYATGYLKFADGTTYRIENSAVSWIRDSNGNLASFTYYPSGVTNYGGSVMAGQIHTATDSNGRIVEFEYDVQEPAPYGLTDRIKYKGFAGGERLIRISKKNLSSTLRAGEVMAQNQGDLFPDFVDVICHPQDEDCIEWIAQIVTYDPMVASAVSFPDGTTYAFEYNKFGELARVVLATGGTIEYDHVAATGDSGGFVRDDTTASYVLRKVQERRTHHAEAQIEKREVFNIENSLGAPGSAATLTTVETFDGPTGLRVLSSKHYFHGNTISSMYNAGAHYAPWRDGKEYKTEAIDASGIVVRRSETDWQQRAYVPWWNSGCSFNCPSTDASPAVDPRIIEVRTIDVPSGQTSALRYDYDEFNNRTDTWEYDYGQGQAGSLLRYTHTDYLKGTYIDNASGSSAHMRRLPVREWISPDNTGSVKVSLKEHEYDNYAPDSSHALLESRSNVVGHSSISHGAGYLARGNPTKLTVYENAQNSSGAISSYAQYDILGNVVKNIDPNGNISTTNYEDNFGSPDDEALSNTSPTHLSGQNTFAFVRSVTNALGWIGETSQYDYFSGSKVNVVDYHGVVSKTNYDFADRVVQTVYAVNTPYENQGTIVYDAPNRRIETTKDLHDLDDNLDRNETIFDSFGRAIETRDLRSGGNLVSKTEYDALGRIKRSSNPYRPAAGEVAVWNVNEYDVLGRPVKSVSADGAEVNYEYFGSSLTVIDQSGRKRRSVSNALGKVVRVDEPNSLGDLGTSANPAQPTSYTYTPTGNLAKVQQGSQVIYFIYYSLGRLLRVRQPEQGTNPSLSLYDPITGNGDWSTGTSYDPVGNVLTFRDARGVTISNSYDALRRLLSRQYSDGTPTINYTYDAAETPYSKGKLTKVDNGVSVSENKAFDKVGRLLEYRQTTDARTFDVSNTYDLSGALIEQTYPSGRKVRTELDENGELAQVKSQKSSGSVFQVYANNFRRDSSGAIVSLKLGNGRFESGKTNVRGQIVELGLGGSISNCNLWKVNFDYGSADNNGNLKSQVIHTGTTSYAQTYEYDGLNRLVRAFENQGQEENWEQTFGYDIYGNRTQFSQVVGGEQLALDARTFPQIDPATNRFLTGQGYEYDQNGNLTKDPDEMESHFNGDNRITEVKDAEDNVLGVYFYDGNGKRVKKVTDEEVVIFVYDSNLKLIAEYSTSLSITPRVTYLTRDHLGTPRVLTDQHGQVVSRRDYMPFGESLLESRTALDGYSVNDGVRQGFTGYQRDTESGLDFAEARFYNPAHGRFTSVDPLLASGKGPNPQTFNRYAYCVNRPLVAIDPTGLSHIIVLVDSNRNAIIIFKTIDASFRYKASAKGQGPRTQMGGDTPFGFYKFSGTEGGYPEFRSKRLNNPNAWGSGIVTTTPTQVGEGTWNRRAGVFLHGGGGTDPFAPTQGCGCLSATLGCVKMYNQDVIALIGQIKAAIANGDKLDNVFIGDRPYLLNLAKVKGPDGKWLYPELRSHFCLDFGTCRAGGNPVLKFQDFDPYAVYDGPLDGEEEDDYALNSLFDDDEEELSEPETDPRDREYVQYDYG